MALTTNHINLMTDILKEQLEIQIKLLDTENEKTDILLDNNVDELNNIINTQQALIMQSKNTEKKRENLCLEIFKKNISLKLYADEYDPNNEYGLKTIFEELSLVTSELKKAKEANSNLLNIRLQSIKQIKEQLSGIDSNDIDEKNITYKNKSKN